LYFHSQLLCLFPGRIPNVLLQLTKLYLLVILGPTFLNKTTKTGGYRTDLIVLFGIHDYEQLLLRILHSRV
jgi:hypothetical protein